MRILSIDYGQKNIGLALSDETKTIAYPYKTLDNNERFFDNLKLICEKENAGEIVVGIPVGFSGETEQTKKVREFVSQLKSKINIPIAEENEVLSTSMAQKRMAEGSDIDQQAAVVILEGYLEKIKIKNQKGI